MTDLNLLRQFLSSWFVDAEGPGGDEAAARRFTHTATAENVRAVLDQAAVLMSGGDETLAATVDREANRYFETSDQARGWLERMCHAVRDEAQRMNTPN